MTDWNSLRSKHLSGSGFGDHGFCGKVRENEGTPVDKFGHKEPQSIYFTVFSYSSIRTQNCKIRS